MYHVPLLQLRKITALSKERLLTFYLVAEDSTNLHVDITLKMKGPQTFLVNYQKVTLRSVSPEQDNMPTDVVSQLKSVT